MKKVLILLASLFTSLYLAKPVLSGRPNVRLSLWRHILHTFSFDRWLSSYQLDFIPFISHFYLYSIIHLFYFLLYIHISSQSWMKNREFYFLKWKNKKARARTCLLQFYRLRKAISMTCILANFCTAAAQNKCAIYASLQNSAKLFISRIRFFYWELPNITELEWVVRST